MLIAPTWVEANLPPIRAAQLATCSLFPSYNNALSRVLLLCSMCHHSAWFPLLVRYRQLVLYTGPCCIFAIRTNSQQTVVLLCVYHRQTSNIMRPN